ncbi:MAG: PHP domain-containing protein [Nitrospinota bacterium]|nr:MAG: PHP domain-containing protein [Nitrospinota bacterium]
MIHQWKADLHIHTHHSDGQDTPGEVVLQAKARQVKAIAITDHDNITGLQEGIALGLREGIEVIPGVELSTCYEDMDDIHLLGYYFDWMNAELRERLQEFQFHRVQRGKAILEKVNTRLKAEGREVIPYEELSARITGSLGRPHIAEQLRARGYVRNNEEAFQQYLIPCNVQKPSLPLPEAMRLLQHARGIPVLAHPTYVTQDRPKLRQLLQEWSREGLLGLEAYHNGAEAIDITYFQKLARAHGLTYTGGSDYHSEQYGSQIGSSRGQTLIPYVVALNLKRCYLHTYPFVLILESLAPARQKRLVQVLAQDYGISRASKADLEVSLSLPLSSPLLFDTTLLSLSERETWYRTLSSGQIPYVILTEEEAWSSAGFPTVLWPADRSLDPLHAPHFVVHQAILTRLRASSPSALRPGEAR